MSTAQQQAEQREEVHADSLRFKVAHCERAINRLKDENVKLKEKIGSLEQEIAMLKGDKVSLLDRISKKQLDFGRLQSEKQALERTIEVRTQRHVAQQQENVTRGEREILQLRIKEADERILHSKLETEKAVKQCHALLLEIERDKETKGLLEMEINKLSRKERQSEQMAKQLEKLYTEKLQVLQVENRELKYNMENLIMDLKMHEKKQEIEGLLTYEDTIGTNHSSKAKNYHSRSHLTATEWKSDLPYADTYRERQCHCLELEEELVDYEEMVQLMKERNQRLEGELQAFKRRCLNLQNIICADNSHLTRK